MVVYQYLGAVYAYIRHSWQIINERRSLSSYPVEIIKCVAGGLDALPFPSSCLVF